MPLDFLLEGLLLLSETTSSLFVKLLAAFFIASILFCILAATALSVVLLSCL